MRTHKDIKEWIEKQPWYSAYKSNMQEQNNPLYETFLNGEAGPLTISHAIDFDRTYEGRWFWEKVNSGFQNWYGSLCKDIYDPKDFPPGVIYFDNQIDWEKRRDEIAKEVFVSRLTLPEDRLALTVEADAQTAVEFADALIEQLKKQ